MNKECNPVKVTKTIRQLDNTEVWHECYDIIEEPVAEILAAYGVTEVFTELEQELLKAYLYVQAEHAEIREASRWAAAEDELLQIIPDRPAPSFRLLELQSQTWTEEKAKHLAQVFSQPSPLPRQQLCESHCVVVWTQPKIDYRHRDTASHTPQQLPINQSR